MVLRSRPKSLREFTRFIWWTQTERRVAANPQIKSIDLGCESAENWLQPSTSAIAIVIITQPVGWYSFHLPTDGGRLSQLIDWLIDLYSYNSVFLVFVAWVCTGKYRSTASVHVQSVQEIKWEQVCFSYLRTLKTLHYPHLLRPRAAAAPAVQQSIDISYPPGPQQQTRRTLLQRADGTARRTDRQTDGQTPYRFIDHASRTMRAVTVRLGWVVYFRW